MDCDVDPKVSRTPGVSVSKGTPRVSLSRTVRVSPLPERLGLRLRLVFVTYCTCTCIFFLCDTLFWLFDIYSPIPNNCFARKFSHSGCVSYGWFKTHSLSTFFLCLPVIYTHCKLEWFHLAKDRHSECLHTSLWKKLTTLTHSPFLKSPVDLLLVVFQNFVRMRHQTLTSIPYLCSFIDLPPSFLCVYTWVHVCPSSALGLTRSSPSSTLDVSTPRTLPQGTRYKDEPPKFGPRASDKCYFVQWCPYDLK